MKRKLFFLLALMLGFVSSVKARTDVTSTYLTDAALENEGTNWALVSNGGNHNWDGTNKYHESWHNTFTITQTTAALPAGYYQLSIQAAVEGGNSTTISLQATSGSNSSVAVYPKYSTHSSYADMAAWWAADASHTGNRNLSRIFTTVYVEEGQTLTATFKQTANNQWFVYGQMQLHMLTDEEGRNAQIFEAVYNPMTNLDMASGRYKQRFESYTAGTVTGKKLNKTISGLPKGKYNVTLNGGASYTSGRGFDGNTGDNLTSFFANNASTNVTVVDRGAIGNQEFTDYTASGGLVTDGNLEVGFNNLAIGANWFVGSVKYIELAEPYISCIAIEIPAATETALTANGWYKFIPASTGDYAFTTTTVGDIIYTTTDQLLSTATGTTATAVIELTEGTTCYIKSSTAQTLTISPQTFTYTVGSATANVSYIQKDNTVTVSYNDLYTDNPSPTLVKDFSGVTFGGNAISVTPTANGFTFTVPTVTAATEYTLAIPANAIGYSDGDGTYNEAQNITLNVPVLFDGIYFLKAAATYDGTSEGTSAAVGKYLARGLNYGTHATLDKYGLPVQITTNANNETTIQAYDTKRYFFHANSYDCYADQASLAATSYFTVTLNNGKLLIHNNSMAAGTYLKYNTSAAGDANIAVFDDGNGTNDGPIIMWTTEDASAHAAVMQSYKDAQAATAAAAAYASGNYASLNGITTVSALEAELEANYIKGDFVKPSAIESISEKYEGAQPGAGNVTEKVYFNTIDITEPGFYKFSMQAFYRAGSNAVTQEMHTNSVDFPPVVLYFGNSETQIKSIYDEGGLDQGIAEGYFETETVGGAPVQYNGKWYTNGQHNSVIIFQKDYYHNDVYFYASEPGTYEYGVKYMGWACANAQWFIYSPESVEITSYAAAADAADYTALQDAIDAYDAATWGFETGEYAPYNNAAAIEKIADARAINPAEDNSKLLVNSLTAYLTLTANATEVNAFGNDGAFSTTKGWENSAWVTTESNYVAVPDGTTITYGNNTSGYTLPLKANTIYELRLRHSGWDGNNHDGGGTVSVLLGEEGLNNATYAGNPSDAKGDDSKYRQETFVFKTGAAGNYVFTLTGNGGRTTVKGFTLVTAPASVSVTLNATTGFSTFASSYPLDLRQANLGGAKAYIATSVDGENIAFEALDQAVPANTGVLFAGNTEQVVTIPVVESGSSVDGNIFEVNTYGTTFDAESGYNYYGLKNNTKEFWPFTPSTVAIPSNKAYLKLSSVNSARLVISFDEEDPTAINAIEAAEEAEGLKDGKYLIDSKIVIVKNGVKYSANGQILK